MNNLENEQLTLYEGSDKTFSLNGRDFTVPARLDAYNYYRSKFEELAYHYATKASKEYIEIVCDFNSFLENAFDIYMNNLELIADNAVDVLVSADIFDYSTELFKDAHNNLFSQAVMYCADIEEQQKALIQSSASAVKGVSDLASSLLGQKSWIVGEFVSGMGEGMAESVTLSEEQAKTLFDSIVPHEFFNIIYQSYCNVGITLAVALNSKNHDIWIPDEVVVDGVANTLQLLAKPNFPQEKVTDLILDLIKKDPYRKDVYDLMKEKFGETEEVLNIIGYFGFSDYTENIFTAEDFPKVEKVTETPAESVEQGKANEQANCKTQGATSQTQGTEQASSEKKGLLSFVDKLDSEKVKKGLKIGVGIAAAGALLNGMAGGSSSKKSAHDEKKDLLGSSNCVLGKKDSRGRTQTCTDCSTYVRSQCTRYYTNR